MNDVVVFVVGNLSLVVLGIICTVIAMLVPDDESALEVPHDAAKAPGEEGTLPATGASCSDSEASDSSQAQKPCASLLTDVSATASPKTYRLWLCTV